MTDAIVPVLQKIDADIAMLGRKIDAQGEALQRHGEKLDAIVLLLEQASGRF